MPIDIQVIDLKEMDYRQAFAIQEEIIRGCDEKIYPDTIIFQQNHPVITLGRSSDLSNLLKSEAELRNLGIDVVMVDRGGDITYHGPGQLVISVLIHIRDYSLGVHQYLRNLEQAVINTLHFYGVNGERVQGKSGVWVNSEKIAATGIGVTHGITRHGIAINIEPDLTHFSYIIPCGISEYGVTSLEKLEISDRNVETVKKRFVDEFCKIFDTAVVAPVWKEGDK
ncbi:MAG: lipoyl(octanoyl) transferase [Firmicutes bacterium HGW-Firmicutes-19]|jgi:lipoyl(octanoyl) transferase|nr:MAG: lipoyl(octanoyl) transferase [Firmicutes bacterium HGW-Firmicutes-19]